MVHLQHWIGSRRPTACEHISLGQRPGNALGSQTPRQHFPPQRGGNPTVDRGERGPVSRAPLGRVDSIEAIVRPGAMPPAHMPPPRRGEQSPTHLKNVHSKCQSSAAPAALDWQASLLRPRETIRQSISRFVAPALGPSLRGIHRVDHGLSGVDQQAGQCRIGRRHSSLNFHLEGVKLANTHHEFTGVEVRLRAP